MELLAPAGDETALRAAVCAGANAVYLGYAQFGARASAANFDAEALERAVAYAHLYHVRVHVTVNTLVKPQETEAVFAALNVIAACRADAVIVQDLGVARMAREAFPTLALHASTQMALHSASGARFASTHGLTRVVLARECDLPTIAAVAATGVETEVFVHGALCAAVSGQCLLSSMAGGRSGNRGRCAQPCRQQVTLQGRTGAWLSMSDLCLRDHLPELMAAGVTSLKIEGRLKRAEYVAVVTDRYRKALDALARGDFAPANAEENTALRQIYQRGGFTQGHAAGMEDAALCATGRVGHAGVTIGAVQSVRQGLATVRLHDALHDGDSLRVEGAQDVELRYAGPDQLAQATLRLRPGETARVGDAVVRTADAKQLQWAQCLTEPVIPVRMQARVAANSPIALQAEDGISAVMETGEIAQVPRSRAMDAPEVARQLAKLGDTPFTLTEPPQVTTDGAFVPVSALNALRRGALEKLAQQRRTAFFGLEKESKVASMPIRPLSALEGAAAQRRILLDAAGTPIMVCEPQNESTARAGVRGGSTVHQQTLAVRFDNAAMGEDFLQAGANFLLYAPREFTPEKLREGLAALPEGAWLALPSQLSDAALEMLRPQLEAFRDRLSGVVLGSVGQLGYPPPLPIALGEGVPITNAETASELLTDQIAFYTHWPELSGRELEPLAALGFPALLKVYGRERVMLLNHCPERVARGLSTGRTHCALCQPGDRACASPHPTLTDRRGYMFPLHRLRMPEGCVVEVYNALPTDLTRQEARRRALGAGMLLSFSVETAEEQLAVTRRFAALMRGERASEPEQTATAGHFLRGVE